MDGYEEHASKASAWRSGRFVVNPDAVKATATVWFAVGASGPEGPVWEGLLCQPLSEDRVRVAAVPFWLYDVNLGDEFAVVRSAEGPLVASGLARDAGNVTFRAVLSSDDAWRTLMEDLEPFGCWFDVRSPTYLAISCSPERAQELADELVRRQSLGELEYETGRSS